MINATTALFALSVSLGFLHLQMALASNVLSIATVVMLTMSVIASLAETDSSWSQSTERCNVRNVLLSARNVSKESVSNQELDTHSIQRKISAMSSVAVRAMHAVLPTHLYVHLAYQDTN